MVYSTKTLGRYDERLARILINYLNQNLKGLLKEDIQTKKDMMAYLKKNLRISAVITKKLSKQEEELVPMRRIYRHLYKLLFASTPLRKSYEAVLNEGNLKDIKKYENLILKEIVYELRRINLSKYIKGMLGKKVQSHFKKFKSYIFGAGRKSGIGHSKLALALVFVAIFLLVTAGVSGYTETGFVSNRTNNARIVSLLKDFGGIMSRISIRDALSLQIPSELHSEAAATSEEIEDWLKEVGILDRNVWKQIMNQPHNLVKDNLERFVRQSLENNYGGRYRINVVEHIQKDSDYTLIGRRLQRNQYSYSISFLVQAAKLLKGAVASNAQGRSQSTIVDFSKQLGVSFVRNNTLRVSFYYDLRIGGSSNNRTDLRFVEIDITFD